MTRRWTATRRTFLQGSAATGLLLAAPPVIGQARIKVAGIHGSPVENAWNSRLHGAMVEAAADGSIEYVFSEGVAGTDYIRAIREYAEDGAQLIVGEVYPVESEAREAAADYPDVAFLMGSSGEPSGENFGTFGTWNHEGAYLAGMLAAHMSESGKFGAVGAIPIPEVNMLINGFRAGVDSVRDDAEHLIGFIGTFFDPPKAREAGLAQVDAGADILFGERIGTADAAKEAGIKAIGSLIDYTPRYPDTVFANAMWYFRPLLDAAVADKLAGGPNGRNYTPYCLMKEGGNDIAYTASMVPAEAIGPMEDARAAIKAGDLEVPIDFSEPT
ncbi:BMP family ABC transporter substrate-binding protein [Pseudooceanicola sp. 216_PA32_1]|jgi:basic membrane protein A and related proteins|uniref:BMP family ABC transporter substrate-binding protein n=1 Tax=Pseudooceanicola pacificus TaxID=2676438 RepID=A0A844W8Q3_9RHOB|nr:BMP family protein [Pseudooceanicola pacificus]MWB76848.1 BMP family ABC transporter substrate-binding protein [Pseudooceanicola pacificus]